MPQQHAFSFQQQHQCEVCNADIPLLEQQRNKDRDLAICGSLECTNVLKQKTRLPGVSFKLYLQSYQQVLKHKQQRLEQRKQVNKEEIAENKLIFKTLSEDNEDIEHFVVIPSGRDKLIPISEERINKYAAHLDSIIEEAIKYQCVDDVPEDDNHKAHKKLLKREAFFEENPAIRNFSDQFCMMCKGGCCSSGEEKAYLSASSIRRVLDSQSELSAAELKDAYLSHLGESAMRNSCINQGPKGCTLPRELRSSICNQFYCIPVDKHQDKIKDKNSINPVVAIQRQDGLWDHAHFSGHNPITNVAIITESECQPIDVNGLKKIPE